MSSFTSTALLSLLSFVLALLSVDATHIDGWTWSTTPALLPDSTTRYAPNCGPQAFIFYYQLLVCFKPLETDQLTYLNFYWGGDVGTRTWSRQIVPGASSPVEGVLVDLPIQTSIIAMWVSENGSFATAVQDSDYNPPQWDQYHQSQVYMPTNIPITPWSDTLDAYISLYHLVPGTTTLANITTDGYSLFEDYPSAINNAWTSGATTKNNADQYMWLFYLGAKADGSGPDGWVWYTCLDNNSDNYQTNPVNTGFPVDGDSTISAVQWNNGSVYNMVFWKYQGEIVYILTKAIDLHVDIHYPTLFHTGINTTSGPSAVSYFDTYLDDYIITVFFSKINPATGQYAVYSAIGTQDNF